MARRVSVSELEQHSTKESVWLVVNEWVYDMTNFATEHPGGADIIYQHAGRDASISYNEIHAPSLIKKTLNEAEHVGILDRSTAPEGWGTPVGQPQQLQRSSGDEKVPLDNIINLYDFEEVARRTWPEKSWAYINGASNDNITRDANSSIFQKIWLRPAIMRNVATVSSATTLFGVQLDMPLYITPTGTAKTAGPEGELALTKAASAKGSILCMSTPTSFPHDEILAATPQQAFFQLYVNKDRQKSEEAVRKAEATGKVKALFVTVDLPVISKREADERAKFDASTMNVKAGGMSATADRKGAGLARLNSSFIDSSLSWDDIAWLNRITKLPLVLKGIQRWEDAKLAQEHGLQGIVLSNHGGRAADTASPAIVTLLELHKNCPEVFDSMEVLVDGGIRRGSDVVKAVCLGASAVGIGRPFLYANNYGQEGVEYAFDILRDEIHTAMQLCGLTDLMRDASAQYVNTGEVDGLVRKGGHPYIRDRRRLKANL
ncbi:uncharacterized protein HMPREF1541_09088 [Cyphellophora europaea CBS 101466]|uniref:L-lactate dehydrogenase (cytochrome) n=1 Tax=Cyphellophora europaea (strain CBS 101466) TaxID=1220924 RepID=W2S9A8_CYPE1|nr:uncharacterized protein HMPREF1541_09088 [Cyphellophora europaea CBS 101466]ETN45257.1 hypothetical protein HMPREF1541_09088 [Cyphellophora europaea CBS 101466]